MTTALTLIADTRPAPPGPAVPEGYDVRSCHRADIPALGRLYHEAYEPGMATSSVEEAIADIEASWAGEYGELWPQACLLATARAPGADGAPAAAILVVRRAPWSDTPDCPFVIELFTARAHRRRGLARALLRTTLATAADSGADHLALRVAADNSAALALYRGLGFREWRHAPGPGDR